MKEVTVVVTSCGRHDLLEKTLSSFLKFNTFPSIKSIIVIEDGPLPSPYFVKEIAITKWVNNKTRKGQIYSIDKAYSLVDTPYIFHLEDDWEFTRNSFIEDSLSILENSPKILNVSLRDDWQHPIIDGTQYGFDFKICKPDWDDGWSGFGFNPGLRRLSDYQKIGSYGKHVGYSPQFCGELHLSKLYRSMGYFTAQLLPAYVKHIGWGERHVEWRTAPKAPKVLIAIPACHKYNYKNQEDGNIHKTQASTSKIDSQRQTWINDINAFSSYVDYKYFFGEGANRKPLADEIFLDCPDDYLGLPKKVKEIIKYAYKKGYDYLFKTDDDTYVHVDRLMSSDFEEHNYTGYCTADPASQPESLYASGGSGYWLSRQAMETLVNANIDDWAEDRWVGKVLYRNGIKVRRDARYLPGFREHYVNLENLPENHSYIALHAVKTEQMPVLYGKTINPTFKLIRKAFGEEMFPVDIEMEFEDTINMLKNSGHDSSPSIQVLVRMILEEKHRMNRLEERIVKFNSKSSYKF